MGSKLESDSVCIFDYLLPDGLFADGGEAITVSPPGAGRKTLQLVTSAHRNASPPNIFLVSGFLSIFLTSLLM